MYILTFDSSLNVLKPAPAQYQCWSLFGKRNYLLEGIGYRFERNECEKFDLAWPIMNTDTKFSFQENSFDKFGTNNRVLICISFLFILIKSNALSYIQNVCYRYTNRCNLDHQCIYSGAWFDIPNEVKFQHNINFSICKYIYMPGNYLAGTNTGIPFTKIYLRREQGHLIMFTLDSGVESLVQGLNSKKILQNRRKLGYEWVNTCHSFT